MKHIILLILLTPILAQAANSELSGNLEAQGRQAWNNEDAREQLQQNWEQEQFYLIYGNLNGKLNFEKSTLEANWFVRHSSSDLYQKDPLTGQSYVAPLIYTFPSRLVARDIFKLQYRNQENDHQTESVLNKFYYEWKQDRYAVTVGRMYINYGQGEIFNPINPFNQPTGITSISQVAQGNDGGALTYFLEDNHSLSFFLLGDKAIEGYTGEIDLTFWLHGDYEFSETLQVDYVLGEDQNRRKLGVQTSFRFSEAILFLQALYRSELLSSEPSHPLWDALLGYDRQLTSKWHLRLETGYQKQNGFQPLNTITDRFLPSEYFAALANQYEIHPLVKLTGTLIHDYKSQFTYFITRSTFDLGHDMEADVFAYLPVAKGDLDENPAQSLLSTDVGLAVRIFL